MTELHELQQELIRALGHSDETKVTATAHAIAEQAEQDFPIFYNVLNILGYYNRLALVNQLMETAWSSIQSATAFSKPAVSAYAARATDHIIYHYVSENEQLNPQDPALLEQLERYFSIEPRRLAPYLKLLAAMAGRRWSSQDFTRLEMQKLNGLMIEFIGYARRYEGVPFARSHLVREHLPRYFLDRQAGNLKPKPDMAAILRQGRRPFPERVSEPPHPLCPDEMTLELFLQRMLQTMDPLPYVAAAILELLPVWLRFLRSRELLEVEQQKRTLHALAGLGRKLAPYWEDHPDQRLQQDVVHWPETSGSNLAAES